MKPFITDALVNSKYILYYQTEGINVIDLKEKTKGLNIIAYSLPKSQTLESTWELRIYFSDRSIIDFSSACTGVGEWEEVGSLNIKYCDGLNFQDYPNPNLYRKIVVDGFNVSDIDFLIFDSADVYSECGVIFFNSLKEEFIVMSGVSPGSVTMLTPFDKSGFSPEFDYDEYRRVTCSQLIAKGKKIR